MPLIVLQDRRVGPIHFAIGLLPFIGAAMWVASAFVLPTVYRGVIDLFVPPGVEAPDNWAVAFTRMVWLYIVSGGIGLIMSSVGLWLSRRAG